MHENWLERWREGRTGWREGRTGWHESGGNRGLKLLVVECAFPDGVEQALCS